ncbi:MAG: cytochrome P450 [Archangium sp.]|nr:cytochrome P450 [Archangium sp.]
MTGPLDASAAPSLPAHFLFGHLPRRRRDPLGMYLESAEKLGGFTRFRFLGKSLYLVTEPDGIQRVLVENAKNYVKGFGYAAMKTVMGEGLVTAEGKTWQEQRRRCQPAFHSKRLEELLPTMNALIEESVAAWGAQPDFDLFRASLALSRRIAARALLSVDSSVDSFDELIPVLQREVSRRSLALVNFRLPFKTARERAFDDALVKLDAFVYAQIRQRRASTGRKVDLLQDLLDKYSVEEELQLRDALVTLFLAAYETTATSLTWILFLVAQHPEAAEAIAAEKDGQVFTRQVVEEGMRLYPAVWLFARKAVEDDVLAGYRVSAGSFVLISPWVNHRLTRFWENPGAFRPERFSPANRPSIPRHAFLPFSAGPRQCIGAGFAMMELVAMVSAVVRRYHLELRSPLPPQFDPLITLQPKDGMKLKLTPRRSA